MHSRDMNVKEFTIEITGTLTRERSQNEVQGMHCVTGQARRIMLWAQLLSEAHGPYSAKHSGKGSFKKVSFHTRAL